MLGGTNEIPVGRFDRQCLPVFFAKPLLRDTSGSSSRCSYHRATARSTHADRRFDCNAQRSPLGCNCRERGSKKLFVHIVSDGASTPVTGNPASPCLPWGTSSGFTLGFRRGKSMIRDRTRSARKLSGGQVGATVVQLTVGVVEVTFTDGTTWKGSGTLRP